VGDECHREVLLALWGSSYTPGRRADAPTGWLVTEKEPLHTAVSSESESGRMPLPSAPPECRTPGGPSRAAFVVRLSGLVECPGMPVDQCMIKAEGAGLDVQHAIDPCAAVAAYHDWLFQLSTVTSLAKANLRRRGFKFLAGRVRVGGSGLLLGRSRGRGMDMRAATCQ
jgi:hypothetical protein